MIDEALKAQREHWDRTFAEEAEIFGAAPSYPALKAAAIFRKERAVRVLELGGGQGRDTLFFAEKRFAVSTLDYSREAVETIT